MSNHHLSNVETFLLCSIPFVLIAFAWMAGRRSSYHRGKSDAFQQVANEFQGLADCTWWPKSRAAARKAERQKRLLSLCLCDENVCKALAAALEDACEHWGYPRPRRNPELEIVSDAVGTPSRMEP